MGKELPEGWLALPFTDIFDINGGTQPPKSQFIDEPKDGYIRLLQIRDFGKKPVPTYIPYKKTLKTCQIDDILIARYGASIGRIVTGQEGAYNVALAKVDIPDLMNKNFVKWILNSSLFQDKITSFQRTAQSGFNKKDLAGIIIPLPPLPEQQRIVAKLDTLFEHLENTKTRLEKVPTLLKNFRQAVLTQAVTGKLTEEWREGKELKTIDLSIVESERVIRGIRMRSKTAVNHNPLYPTPESWIWCKLHEIALKITDGAHNTPKVRKEGFPYLMAKDLTGGFMDFSQEQFLGEKDHRELWNKCLPEVGDLLIVNIGAGTGNNVLVNVQFEFSFKNIAIVKRSSVLIPKFLKFYFDNQKSIIFNSQTRGGAQPFLSLTALNDIDIVVPPLEEQTEIVRRVESLFAKADAIESKYKLLKEKIDNLPQTILSKAFKGELVKQLESDGDARELLEEIKKLKLNDKKK